MKKPRITKRRLALFTLAALAIIAVGVEVVVRLFGWGLGYYIHDEKFWVIEDHTNLFGRFDAVRQIDIQGRLVKVDRPAGKKRVIVLGSSSTYGAGLADRSRAFPGLLDERLPEIEVINAGFGGYNSFQLWVYLDEVLLKLRPDLVIFYYGGNEGYGESAKTYYRRAREIIATLAQRGVTDPSVRENAVFHGTANQAALTAYTVLGASRAFLLWRDHVVSARYYANLFDPLSGASPRPPFLERILRDMSVAVQTKGGRILFVPEVNSARREANLRVGETMRETCAATGAVCLDALQPGIIDDNALFIDSTHLTERGHERLADLLAPFVAELSE